MEETDARQDFSAGDRAQVAEFRRASKYANVIAAVFVFFAVLIALALAGRFTVGSGGRLLWWHELLVYVLAAQLVFALVQLVQLALYVRHVAGPRWGIGFSKPLVRPHLVHAAITTVFSVIVALVTWGAEQRHEGAWLLGLVPVLGLNALLANGSFQQMRAMYRMEPLTDDRVRRIVAEVASDARVPAPRVMVMPVRAFGEVENAYVVKARRTSNAVVLYDTVLTMGEAELRSLVAHELGHIALGHLRWRLRYGVLASGVVFVAAMFLAGYSNFVVDYEQGDPIIIDGQEMVLVTEDGNLVGIEPRADVDEPSRRSDPVQYIDYMFTGMFLLGAINLVYALPRSRRDEAAADRFALDVTRDPHALRSLQRRMTVANGGPIDARGLRGVGCTHPPATERIAMAADWARENNVPFDA